MAEDRGLCTYFRFHKHKIILFLAAMRNLRDELRSAGLRVVYHELSDDGLRYEARLLRFLKSERITKISIFEVEDKFFEDRLLKELATAKVEVEIKQSPLFLFSRSEFSEYVGSVKKPYMKTFYERQRRRHKILLQKSGEPQGGRWSLDSENRKKLPQGVTPPPPIEFEKNQNDREVMKVVDQMFADHPGESENFWLATQRFDAERALDDFLECRLKSFGDYQDAIHSDFVFNFHSVLSPYINIGLLTPDVVLKRALKYRRQVSLNSLEGFVRQLVGWREFIRGVYQNYSEQQERSNFWNHRRKLSKHWYLGTTGVPPLDDAIKKAVRYGYCHHIERLMILSNFMLLCEVDPHESYRWFMEMFVDSSDWVMGPNVYGMGQFSDGGLFATKPYISGSNYILKMSNYKKGDWCEIHDGLFWSFLSKHRSFFESQPRLGMLVKTLDRMEKSKKKKLFECADQFKARVTCE